MRIGLKLSQDGIASRVELDHVDHSTLSILQEAVEGTIDMIELAPTLHLYINDEGKFTHGINEKATRMFRRCYDTRDFIAGPVVIVGGVDDEGNDIGLTPGQLSTLEFMLS